LINDELLDLQQKFSADNRLAQFLRNPVVTRKNKADFIRHMFGPSISDTAERTISLLCKNNRLEMLPSIVNMFALAMAASKRSEIMTVISSQELSEHQKGTIKTFINNKFGSNVSANFLVPFMSMSTNLGGGDIACWLQTRSR
jgi:ATP synthase F1 delta subunit